MGRTRLGELLGIVLVLGMATTVSATETIPLGEIQPGMRGYGLTVFSGGRIDTFGVEVVGVQEKSKVDGNVILIEVGGHDLELSKIAQGMSGSPIYLDGRFAGALAFGWPGSLKPLAGVTPAAEMLRLPREAAQVPEGGGELPPEAVRDWRRLGTGSGELARTLGLEQAGNPPASIPAGWPEPRKLAVAMLEERLRAAGQAAPEHVDWFFQPSGLARGTSGRPAGAGDHGLQPGSACGIPLVMGDAVLGVTGTVSYVDGDDVLMMGHPFMQRGPVDLPLATAEVLTIVPSREMSFKMGGIRSVVGRVHHDLRAGLVGKLGEAPGMIPVALDVVGDFGTRSYHFEVVDDPLLTPTLVFWTLYNSLLVQGDDASSQNLSYDLDTRWTGDAGLEAEGLRLRGVAGGPGGAMSLAAQWMTPFALLMDNPFQKVRLRSVDARIELSRPVATARIAALDAPRHPAVRDDRLEVDVTIVPRLGEPRVRRVSLPLPPTLAPGPYRLVAASEAEFFTLEATRAPNRFQVRSLDSALEILTEPRAADHLVVALLGPGSNLVVADREFGGLPASTARVLTGGNMQIQSTMADIHARRSDPVPWALQGHAVRKLEIRAENEPLKEERRP